MTAGGGGRSPRRARGGLPSDLPDWLRNAAPRDLVSVEPNEDGSLPSWPHGPFKELSAYPDLALRLRQVAGLAADAERFRKGRDWTRAQVAKRAGLNVSTYGDFEAGRTWPVETTLYRVAGALELELHYVARGTLDRQQSEP